MCYIYDRQSLCNRLYFVSFCPREREKEREREREREREIEREYLEQLDFQNVQVTLNESLNESSFVLSF